MTSINTNVGALAALQSLRATQADLSETSNRLNTGLKVSDATDNPGVYAIAQDLRARVATQANIRDGIDRMSTTIDAGLTAADNVQKLLIEMRTKASAVMSGNLNAAQLGMLNTEFVGLRDQINALVSGAQVNGVNVLGDATLSYAVRVNDADLTQVLTVTGYNLTASALGVAVLVADTAANASTAVQTISAAIGAVNTAMSGLAARSKIMSMMKDFSQRLSESIEKSIGLLVDADMPRESSRLQALQTKQQLNIQTLAIANQAPQMLLQLFR